MRCWTDAGDLNRLMSARVSPAWEVYIIRAVGGLLYTGVTTDPLRRIDEHRSRRAGASFFRFAPPETIVYREVCRDRSQALRREAEIKRMPRRRKLELIASL